MRTCVVALVALSCNACSDKQRAGLDLGARDAPAEDGAAGQRPQLTIATYPKVDGSTSNIPLARAIACDLLGLPYVYVQLPAMGEQPLAELTILPLGDTEADWELAGAISTTIVHHKTHEAELRLIDGQVDLILVASPPSADEQAAARTSGVTLEWKSIALDALVFMVNADNPIDNLTSAQVLGIFLGQITNWRQVGGPDRPIRPYSRPQNSGSQQLMEALVLRGRPSPAWPPDRVQPTMAGLVDSLKDDANGIGYSVYYYVTYQYPIDRLKPIAIDGQRPSQATIASRAYPFVAPVLAVYRSDLAPTSSAAQLRDWLRSADGQRVVATVGYAPAGPAASFVAAHDVRPACRTEPPSAEHRCDLWSSNGAGGGSCAADEVCAPACDASAALTGACTHVQTSPPALGEECGWTCAAGLVCSGARWRPRCRPICDPWAADRARSCPSGQHCFRLTEPDYFVSPDDGAGVRLRSRPYGFCAPALQSDAWPCPAGQWCQPYELDAGGHWLCECIGT